MRNIETMRAYALEHNVPIMEESGLAFLCDFIKRHEIKSILEIGSAIGYSAIMMCNIDPQITITTIERDKIRYDEAVQNVAAMGLNERIKLVLGDALEVEIEGIYDLVFIDAAKAQYIKFFEKYKGNLKDNGYIISDNLGFHGLVDDHSLIKSRNMRQLIRKLEGYHTFLKENKEFKTTFIKTGDGVGISYNHHQDFKGIIFDMDGLLVDSEKVSRIVWYELGKKLGYDMGDEFFFKIIGTNSNNIMKVYYDSFGDKISFEDAVKSLEEILDNYLKEYSLKAKKGAIEILDYLHKNNYKIALATSSDITRASLYLKLADIDINLFDAVITGDMIKNSKPQPDIFLKACEKVGLNIRDCLVVEDSLNGCKAALNAGIHYCLIEDLVKIDEDIKDNAYLVEDSLLDLLAYFKAVRSVEVKS